jgi:alanine racemase
MDQLTVDVSDVGTAVRHGDDVVLFGEQGSARLGADEVGGFAGTIEREILTAVPDRIPRVVTHP